MRKVHVNRGSLKETRAYDWVLRFVFGGLSTVVAGLIAKKFGPGIGGLFLAFPAIFPASATLIESHQKRKLAEIGADGTNRGRMAASIDAKGTAFGCVGLSAFGLILWKGLPEHAAELVVAAAGLGWMLVSYALWMGAKVRLRG